MSAQPGLQPEPFPAAALFGDGETVPSGADRPFLLEGERAWLVESGYVDVFAVRVEDGRPAGPRAHLLRVGTGQALFGTPPAAREDHGLLAVGSADTRLIRTERQRLAARDARGHDLSALLAVWIDALYEAITRDRLPAQSRELVTGAEAEVEAGTCVRPQDHVAWIRHLRGTTCLLGRTGLTIGPGACVPVSRRGWLEAVETAVLAAAAPAELPPETLWSGLGVLHGLALRHAELTAREADVVAQDRLQRRDSHRLATLRDACLRLAGAMSPEAHPRAGLSEAADAVAVEDPLFAACAAVGRALGIAMKPHPQAQGAAPPRDPLAAIANASRVRARQVALRGTWWKEDNGPLLAFRAEGRTPVALLRPQAAGPYVLHEPSARTTQRVDAAVAETLEPMAQSFYRPFPEKRLRLREVVRFALQGCGRDALMLFAVAVGGTVLGMVPALATGMLFDTVIPGAQRSQLLQMTLVLLACAATTSLFSLAQGVAVLRIERRASAGLQAAVWDRLLALPLGFFRPYTAGDLAVRAMAIDGIRQVVSGSTVSALIGSVMAAGNIALMFWYSGTMALWASAVIALLVGVALLGGIVQARPQREALKLQSKAAGVVLQLLSGIAKIRVAGAEVPAFALWVRRFSAQRGLQYQSRRTANWVAAFNAAVPLVSYLVVFAIALPLVTEDRTLSTGTFLAFLSAFSFSTTALVGASMALLSAFNVMPLYEQAKPILEALPEVDAGKADPGQLTGDIEVQHAIFRYHQDGPLVLRDISFHVKSGEFVAFVGPSGSGKSTLLRLLLGFETLESGTIHYDGQEVSGLDMQAVRRQMGAVLQSGRLMSGEIFANIVGSNRATVAEAWEAARMAGLAEDIEAMPMGMHTVVSEGGGTLSGGQRQRLLIARAVVNKPWLLLFDEATSALDNRTQAIVSRSLEQLQATRVVIAHRLSTIVNADRIYVIERGRLVQSGTYEELIAQPGAFADMAKRQIA
ncbi:MAG: NHLP bacteriocin export ABC transporter permease/ATPase subunit [Vicinamibacteria bacterium]